jgi:hypothetical protein
VTFTVPWDSTTDLREVWIDDGKRATIVGQDQRGKLVTAQFPTDEHAIGHIKEGNGRVRFGDGSVRTLPPPKQPWSLATVFGLLALGVLVAGSVLVVWRRSARRS